MEELEVKLQRWIAEQISPLSEPGSPYGVFSLFGTIGLDVAVDRDGRVLLNEGGLTSNESAAWKIATPEERVGWLRRCIAEKQ